MNILQQPEYIYEIIKTLDYPDIINLCASHTNIQYQCNNNLLISNLILQKEFEYEQFLEEQRINNILNKYLGKGLIGSSELAINVGLIEAIIDGNVEAVKILLNKGANPRHLFKYQNAYDYATESYKSDPIGSEDRKNHGQILSLLMSHNPGTYTQHLLWSFNRSN